MFWIDWLSLRGFLVKHLVCRGQQSQLVVTERAKDERENSAYRFLSFAFIAIFMSSRNLSSRGGAGAAVVDDHRIYVPGAHLHNERPLVLAVIGATMRLVLNNEKSS